MPLLASDSCPSITGFRSRIRSLLVSEGLTASRRDIIILAIDGIPHELALASWPHANIYRMCSVFPTTSSTAWLSSLTGAEVERHGIPGVVFKIADGELINIFEYRGWLDSPTMGNIFSDAVDNGYFPISVMGDLEPYDCAWRSALLSHSQLMRGYRFYTAPQPNEPTALCQKVLRAVSACLEVHSSKKPKLVWCFIDADRHIHHRGYDEDLMRFLGLIEDLALGFTRQGAVVIAHSDHGLTRTNHNLAVQLLLEQLQAQYKCVIGGAGRTRWIYARPATEDHLFAILERSLPSTIRVCLADEVFGTGSLARARVGAIVLIAKGEEFMTFSGQQFEHGSATEAELYVPFAQWTA